MPMGARSTAFLAAIVLCVGASCAWIEAQLSQRAEREQAEVPEATEEAAVPVAYDPEEPLVERRRRAIAHLENAREEEARLELAGILHQFPSDSRSRDLMHQIDATPEEYFAPAFRGEFSNYELPFGSSLSGVAKECLGDSLKFYALWKLNRDNPSIARPNAVEGATTIRIPGSSCGRGVPPPVQPSEKTQADAFAEIDEAIGSRAYRTALTLIDQAEAEYGPVPEVVSRRERVCGEYARKTEKRNPSRAAELYVCAADIKLARARTLDEKLEVLSDFERAAKLDPGGEGPSRLAKVRADLKREVNRLHTEAHRAMRAGDCETASSLWRKALRIDPDEDRAQAGLSRCRYQGP
jgi:hypothetical protein